MGQPCLCLFGDHKQHNAWALHSHSLGRATYRAYERGDSMNPAGITLQVRIPASMAREIDDTWRSLSENEAWMVYATDRLGRMPKRSDFLRMSIQDGSRLVRETWGD